MRRSNAYRMFIFHKTINKYEIRTFGIVFVRLKISHLINELGGIVDTRNWTSIQRIAVYIIHKHTCLNVFSVINNNTGLFGGNQTKQFYRTH